MSDEEIKDAAWIGYIDSVDRFKFKFKFKMYSVF